MEALRRPLEADEPAEERVVAAVGVVAVLAAQELVEPDLRGGERLGHVDSHGPKPPRRDRDEEGFDGLPPFAEVRHAGVDEILSREIHVYTRSTTAAIAWPKPMHMQAIP